MSYLSAFANDLRVEGYSRTTIAEYVRRLGKLEEPVLTARAAKDHLAKRRDVASVNDSIVEMRALKAFSRWFAAEYNGTDELVSMPFAKGTKAAPGKIASADVIKTLLGRMQKSPALYAANVRDIAIIELLSLTGCRRGEVSKLDVADVDFERGRLTFRDTKNRDERHVPLHPKLARSLRRWIAKREGHRLADKPALFLGRDGRLGSNGIGQLLERLCRDYDVEKISAHQLRRHFAHAWAEAGGRDDELMALGGWRSLAMPAMYRAELAKQRAAAAYERIMAEPENVIRIKPGRRRG